MSLITYPTSFFELMLQTSLIHNEDNVSDFKKCFKNLSVEMTLKMSQTISDRFSDTLQKQMIGNFRNKTWTCLLILLQQVS